MRHNIALQHFLLQQHNFYTHRFFSFRTFFNKKTLQMINQFFFEGDDAEFRKIILFDLQFNKIILTFEQNSVEVSHTTALTLDNELSHEISVFSSLSMVSVCLVFFLQQLFSNIIRYSRMCNPFWLTGYLTLQDFFLNILKSLLLLFISWGSLKYCTF